MRSNILLLNSTKEWYHFGCTTTSTVLEKLLSTIPDSNLNIISIEETYKIQQFPKFAEEFDLQYKFEIFKKHNSNLISKIKDSDIIVVNGEGTLHGLRDGPLSLLYTCFIAKKFLGKKVAIINHSVYPQDDLTLNNPQAIALYKKVYNILDFGAVREQLSFDLIMKLIDDVNKTKFVQSFDLLPLYIKDHYKTQNIKEDKTLVISGSAAWNNLNMLSNDPGAIQEYENALSQFIDYLTQMKAKGYNIKFLYGALAHPSKDDAQLMNYLKQKVPNLIDFVEAKSLKEWLETIDQASLLVSGRFHHTIAAFCLNTPFIILNSNTPKTTAISERFLKSPDLNFNEPNLFEQLNKNTEEISSKESKIDHSHAVEKLCLEGLENITRIKLLSQSETAEISQHYI